jgi:bifunctional DNA-binding transcriptional regulator/antitoxin component of YhaV-PrlF toxin-antitoxin module
MDRLNELRELLNTFEKDFVKFYEKGNKSAGTRVRKHMNELKRKAQDIRKEIQEIKGKTPTGSPVSEPAHGGEPGM